MGTLIRALTSVNVVGFLVEDVVDSIDQEVKGEGHPNKNWKDLPVPDVTGKPHAHDGCSNGVDPENGSRNLN
jgi:hypothetical protein